jgi:hypothetical protein
VPSQLHEALLLLFRNRPALAPELLRDTLRVDMPPYTEARIESAELTDVQPAECLSAASIDELDAVGERLLTARTLEEARAYAEAGCTAPLSYLAACAKPQAHPQWPPDPRRSPAP